MEILKDENGMVKITQEILEAGRNLHKNKKGRIKPGGHKWSQLALLGVPLPLTHGWQKKLLKSKVHIRGVLKFLASQNKNVTIDKQIDRFRGHPVFPKIQEPWMSWKEQYQHPNWQRLRCWVLTRDQFKCKKCGDGNTMLHVHHIQYRQGVPIWDYPKEDYITLCEKCHAETHNKPLPQKPLPAVLP